MQAQSITQKQQYLRENIIDAGFDAQDFVQYCTEQHNLSDLADWSITKLKEVVQIYVQMKNIQKNNPYKVNMQEEQQWTNFQESPPQVNQNQNQIKKQPQNNTHNHTKTGNLVFREEDWGIFLGTGPIDNNSKSIYPTMHPGINKNTEVVLHQKKIQQIKKKVSEQSSQQKIESSKKTQLNSFQNIGKQNPLSPPSKDIVKDTTILNNLIQEGGIKIPVRGPINFTNVKLATGKVKVMPKLPQINDIIITKTEQVARNFLQSDYTNYHVHFLPGNHIITRKFADFRKLRSIMQNLYPHIRLPYLQPEGWLTSSQGKDTQTLAKYKWMIIDFLKYIIMRNQQLKNSPLVRKFCGYSTSMKSQKQTEEMSKHDLKKTLQGYENLPKPKTIGQLCLTEPYIILPPSNDGQKSLANTSNTMQQIDHEYQKLRKKFDTLFYNYEVLAKSMSDVSNSFETLQNIIKKYNFDNNQPKQYRIYQGLRQVCIKMQNTMNQQYVIFKSRIKSILRYQKDNMMTLKQLFQSKSRIHYQYSKQSYPILSKSSQSNCGQVQIDNKISLQQPCKNNKNNLCVQEIFWSYYVKEEIKKYWEELRKKINQQLTMISYQQLDNQNDNLNFWNSMIKKCVV